MAVAVLHPVFLVLQSPTQVAVVVPLQMATILELVRVVPVLVATVNKVPTLTAIMGLLILVVVVAAVLLTAQLVVLVEMVVQAS